MFQQDGLKLLQLQHRRLRRRRRLRRLLRTTTTTTTKELCRVLKHQSYNLYMVVARNILFQFRIVRNMILCLCIYSATALELYFSDSRAFLHHLSQAKALLSETCPENIFTHLEYNIV